MRLSNLFKNLLLLLISVVISLLVLEFVSRKYLTLVGENWHDASDWTKELWLETHKDNPIATNYPIDQYDSIYGWTLKSNLRHVLCEGGAVSSNSKGGRGEKEVPYEKTSKMRILTIGDSFTFGECVSDTGNFPAILETMLDSAEVINLAVHGYGNDQQLLKLLNEGVQYHPDIVVLGFLNDDINRNKISFRDFAKPYYVLENDSLKLRGVPVPPPDFFLNSFRWKSWGLLKAKWAALTEHSKDATNEIITERILSKMYGTCKAINAKLIVVYLPWQKECSENKPFHAALFDSLAAKPGVIAIDPTFAMHNFLSTQQHPDSNFICHYSPALNRVIAQQIAVTVKLLSNKTQP